MVEAEQKAEQQTTIAKSAESPAKGTPSLTTVRTMPLRRKMQEISRICKTSSGCIGSCLRPPLETKREVLRGKELVLPGLQLLDVPVGPDKSAPQKLSFRTDNPDRKRGW